jgi:hypothetical protein
MLTVEDVTTREAYDLAKFTAPRASNACKRSLKAQPCATTFVPDEDQAHTHTPRTA